MQAVQNNTTSSINNNSNNTKTQQNTNNSLFQSLLTNQSTPEDISFEEYKNLSEENLKNLFGDDEKALRDAKGLKHTSSWTNDDTFNSIIFNIYADDIKNGTNNGQSYFHAQLLTVSTLNEITLDPNNMDQIPPSEGTNMKDAKEMLSFLANIEENIQTYGDKNKWKQITDREKVIEVAKNIVEQYNTKVGESNAVLASYTKTNSSSPINSITSNNKFDTILEDKTYLI